MRFASPCEWSSPQEGSTTKAESSTAPLTRPSRHSGGSSPTPPRRSPRRLRLRDLPGLPRRVRHAGKLVPHLPLELSVPETLRWRQKAVTLWLAHIGRAEEAHSGSQCPAWFGLRTARWYVRAPCHLAPLAHALRDAWPRANAPLLGWIERHCGIPLEPPAVATPAPAPATAAVAALPTPGGAVGVGHNWVPGGVHGLVFPQCVMTRPSGTTVRSCVVSTVFLAWSRESRPQRVPRRRPASADPRGRFVSAAPQVLAGDLGRCTESLRASWLKNRVSSA